MAVRLGKYYLHINNGVWKYIKHLYSAQKCFHPAIYILVVPRNTYMSAQIFICLRGYSWASTQIFWFARKYLVYPQKCIHCPRKIICCAEIFSSCAQTFCLRAEIIRSQPF